MPDRYNAINGAPSHAASDAFVITPGSALRHNTRAVWVGGAGNLKATMVDGTEVTFSGVAAGTLLPIQVSAVASSGTTATLLLGLV